MDFAIEIINLVKELKKKKNSIVIIKAFYGVTFVDSSSIHNDTFLREKLHRSKPCIKTGCKL